MLNQIADKDVEGFKVPSFINPPSKNLIKQRHMQAAPKIMQKPAQLKFMEPQIKKTKISQDFKNNCE